MNRERSGCEDGVNPNAREKFIAEKIAEIEAKFGKPINEVIAEKEKVLGTIAKMVGGDFGMEVKFGIPGSGDLYIEASSENPKELWNHIIFDPLGLNLGLPGFPKDF